MSDDRLEGYRGVQVLSLEQFIDELAAWPETIEANWAQDNPVEVIALYRVVCK